MRSAALFLLALLAAGVAWASAPQDACGVLVCAGAHGAIGMDCGHAFDPSSDVAFAWCTVTMAANVSGASLLPGRVAGSAAGHVSFTCLNGCASRNADAAVPLQAAWRGGPVPGPLGLGPGAGQAVQVLRETAFTFQPADGSRTCVHANASLAVRADAAVVDVNGTTVPVEVAHAEDLPTAYGEQCL
jgi:hypothetical protein